LTAAIGNRWGYCEERPMGKGDLRSKGNMVQWFYRKIAPSLKRAQFVLRKARALNQIPRNCWEGGRGSCEAPKKRTCDIAHYILDSNFSQLNIDAKCSKGPLTYGNV
jgi:hypothetical protein